MVRAHPPNGAIVSVIGCLAKVGQSVAAEPRDCPGADDSRKEACQRWSCSGCAAAAHADPYTSGECLSRSREHQGHRMVAKDLLIKDAAGDRINVLSLEMLASSCGD